MSELNIAHIAWIFNGVKIKTIMGTVTCEFVTGWTLSNIVCEHARKLLTDSDTYSDDLAA